MPIIGAQGSTKGPSTAPTVGTATVTNSTTVSLTFTAPSFSKLPITSYTVTSSPSISLSTSGSSSPVTVTGTFASNQAYTYTIVANHANGSSTASSASNSITPLPVTANGYVQMSNTLTVLQKFNMVAETHSTVSVSGMDVANYGGHVSDSGVSMYRMGSDGNPYTANQKMSYSSETASNLANTLPQGRFGSNGMSNSGTAGYVVGGATAGYSTRYKTIVKMPFSTDVPATLGTGFTNMGNAPGNCSNNHTAGYTFGGYSDTTGPLSLNNKITYSNDSISNSVSSLPATAFSNSAMSNDGTAAYVTGGRDETTNIYKVSYSNDARTTTSATIADNLVHSASVFRYQTAGYLIGGRKYPISEADVNYIQKFLYSTETRSTIAATLAAIDRTFCSTGASNNGVI